MKQINAKFILALILIIPLASSMASAAAGTHTVKSGDTLSGIASRNNLSLRQLLSYNPQLIKPGMVLNLAPVTVSVLAPVPAPVQPVVVTPVPTVPTPVLVSAPTTVPSQAGEIRFNAYTTAYTYWDNTPAGTANISHPILHQKAGGTGTYADPITIAVGHSIINGKDILDFPAGTKFYIPNVQRYFIVEDTCGDGNTPQNGACHTGYPAGTSAWLDMWIDGASSTAAKSASCASALTDSNGVVHLVIQNPAPNYKVIAGPVIQNGICSAQFGNTPVLI
jgi:LysM domain